MAVTKLFQYFLKTTISISNFLLIVLTFIVALEVVCRKLFNYSFTFVTALTAFVFPWLVFLAIISVTKNNDHIGVSFFLNKMKGRTKTFFTIFNKVVMLVFSVFMLLSSYKLTVDVVDITIPIIEISRSWLYLSMIIAFLGTSIVLIVQIVGIIRHGNEGETTDDLGHGL